jgi:hypothetical protein
MQKKLISGTIASAVAMSAAMGVDAAPKPRPGLDNPLDDPVPPSCEQVKEGFVVQWFDPNGNEPLLDGDTKFGGDIEFDALLSWTCNFEGTEAEGDAGVENSEGSETATVDIDLSRDASDPFYYGCEFTGSLEQIVCGAFVDWTDITSAVNDAAEDKFGDLEAQCTAVAEVCTQWENEEVGGYCEEWDTQTVAGNFETSGATLEDVAFGVKEMNPGKGNGPQNYEKAFGYCTFTPDI